jgi:hypothetical protein
MQFQWANFLRPGDDPITIFRDTLMIDYTVRGQPLLMGTAEGLLLLFAPA